LKTAQKTITKLWNASSFVFMHLKDYVAGKSYDPEKLEIMDRWLLIKLNHLINSASNNFEVYEYSKSKKDAEYFFWNVLCDNYLEIVKDRLYNPDNRGEISRLSGQYTLYNSLLSVLKIFAPIIPFVTEEIHDVYFAENEKEETLHLSNWPEPDVALDNVTVEKVGDRFVEILGELRKFKSDNGKSLKEEVEVVLIEDDFKLLEKCMDDFKATTNARSVESGKEFSINF
jgi:valyl-tRNA synthetase